MGAHVSDNIQKRPLFITGNSTVASELLRLAAAAGTVAWRACDAAAAADYWMSAGTVVIAADAARNCAEARLPRRPNVILLTGEQLSYEEAWPLALTMGGTQVATLPVAAGWLTRRLVPAVPGPSRGTLIAITGARGGVGSSVLSCGVALAAAAQSSGSALLIDADPRGGGLDLTLGWEKRAGLRWPQLVAAGGPYDPAGLRASLPGHDGLALLSFDRGQYVKLTLDNMVAVVDAARLAFEHTVVDIPRHGEEWLAELVASQDQLVLIVPAEVRAVAAARQVVARFADRCDRVRLVVRGPSPGRLSAADISEAVGIPLAAQLHTDHRLATAAETGSVPSRSRRGNLASVARHLLAPRNESSCAPQGENRTTAQPVGCR